jgi:predicted RNA-binding Zn-ribbon protein involved in translation (DUF1610 family)
VVFCWKLESPGSRDIVVDYEELRRELAEKDHSEKKETEYPTVLHLLTQDAYTFVYGRAGCDKCGENILYRPDRPQWTEDPKVYACPPVGFVACDQPEVREKIDRRRGWSLTDT